MALLLGLLCIIGVGAFVAVLIAIMWWFASFVCWLLEDFD